MVGVLLAGVASALASQRAYRGDAPPLDLAGKDVILVDDGLATGSSIRAAIEALRRLQPARIVVAVPAAPESTCQELTAVEPVQEPSHLATMLFDRDADPASD